MPALENTAVHDAPAYAMDKPALQAPSAQEYQTFQASRSGSAEKTRALTEKGELPGLDLFNIIDINDDGSVHQNEMANIFAMADGDRDGSLTNGELVQFMEDMKPELAASPGGDESSCGGSVQKDDGGSGSLGDRSASGYTALPPDNSEGAARDGYVLQPFQPGGGAFEGQPFFDTLPPGRLSDVQLPVARIDGDNIPDSIAQYVTMDGGTMIIDAEGEQLPPLEIVRDNVEVRNARISNPSGDAIFIHNANNVTVANSELGNSLGMGVQTESATNVTIQNNKIHNVMSGVYAVRGGDINVTGNDFRNAQGPYPRGQFVQFDKVTEGKSSISFNNVLEESGKNNTEDNISLFHSANVTVESNYIDGSGTSDTGSGIMNEASNNVVIRDNVVMGQRNVAIGVAAGENVLVENNTVTRNTYSIYSRPYGGYGITNVIVRNNRGDSAGLLDGPTVADGNNWNYAG